MTSEPNQNLTVILLQAADGAIGAATATNLIFEAVYNELRHIAGALMQGERVNHTLQPTALIGEAYLRLVDEDRLQWQNRAHFFSVAVRAMRQILVEHARKRNAGKRGGDLVRVTLTENIAGTGNEAGVLEIEAALEKLEKNDERMARIVEYRFYGGLTGDEIAHLLGVTRRTVQSEWKVAKMWLARELAP